MGERTRIEKILELLELSYGHLGTALNYATPFQLLIATVLSAQCTDVRVNEITAVLFKHFPTVEAFAQADEKEIAAYIKGCGLYRNKSRYLKQASIKILHEYQGEVPDNRESLMQLPGVGRKTANVVIANAFNQDAIAVDTHVFRVANRLKLADSQKVLEVEQQLMQNIAKNKWSEAHHWLIYHGRQICKARRPLCSKCIVSSYCPEIEHEVRA